MSLVFKFPEHNRAISIASVDVPFFEDLNNLPDIIKIKLFNISYESMQVAIDRYWKEAHETLAEYFKDEWLDVYNADPVILNAEYNESVFGLKLTSAQLLRNVKTKKITMEQCNKIIEYFQSGKEVYRKKDRE